MITQRPVGVDLVRTVRTDEPERQRSARCRRLGLKLFAVLLVLLPRCAWGQMLAGLSWERADDLKWIAHQAVDVRLVTDNKVFVELDDTGLTAVRQRGWHPFLLHEGGDEGEYYLTCLDHGPPLDDGAPIYEDAGGWALLWLGPDDPANALPYFLYPLPSNHSIRGWTEAPRRGKPLAALGHAAMRELLAAVDEERLRQDVRTLSLLDPAASSTFDNLRTRFTVHPQTLEATEYIRSELAAALGPDAVDVKEFTIPRARLSGHLRGQLGTGDIDKRAYNVIGELAGTDPEAGYYVICAHYDATAIYTPDWDWRTDPAPGADDNATGVALVLEVARILAAQRLPWSIRFIAFSGEEIGLLGSREYAMNAAARDDRILGVLNFDMIGYNDLLDRVEIVANPASAWLSELMIAAGERYEVGLRIDQLVDAGARQSDHAPFWSRGYDAILAIENYLPTDSTTYAVRENLYRVNRQMHTVEDVPDSLNWGLVRKVTQLAVATLAQYVLEEDLPNLAVSGGDLHAAEGGLRLLVRNLGTAPVDQSFRVEVSVCRLDSTACAPVWSGEHDGLLAPGAAAALAIPWEPLGDTVFRVDVDPEDRIQETDTSDNRVYQRLHLQPRDRIVLYPNPFHADGQQLAVFAGLPLKARVRVYAADGQLVWSAQEDDLRQRRLGPPPGEVWWLGVNNRSSDDRDAPLVAGGIYYYVVSTADDVRLQRGTMAVLRP